MKTLKILCAATTLLIAPYISVATPSFAVWLDGDTSAQVGDGILNSLDNAFGPGTWTLVSDANLATAGFLNSFDTLIMSRQGAAFGVTSISPTAAANIQAYVGSGATQGGVALFANDAKDNFFGSASGDPYDANLNQLFVNAATFAAASGHGFIGEFNGTVIALNTLGLLPGSASSVAGYGPQFTYDVGPIGAGNPIDAGVTFPFTDSDNSTFLTTITGADPNNIVDVFGPGVDAGGNIIDRSIVGVPAVLANRYVIQGGSMPDAGSTLTLLGLAMSGLVGCGRYFQKRRA